MVDFATTTSNPVLVILDINMPRMDGKETLAEIRKHPHFQNVPVVVYSTSINKSDEEYCKKLNATFVNKPNNVEGVKQVAKIIADFCRMA